MPGPCVRPSIRGSSSSGLYRPPYAALEVRKRREGKVGPLSPAFDGAGHRVLIGGTETIRDHHFYAQSELVGGKVKDKRGDGTAGDRPA